MLSYVGVPVHDQGLIPGSSKYIGISDDPRRERGTSDRGQKFRRENRCRCGGQSLGCRVYVAERRLALGKR